MAVKRGRLFAIALGLVVVAVADVATGYFRWRVLDRAGENGARLERAYRTPNPYYHHGLEPNYSTDSAMWGPIVYSVRTNSLGFRDSVVREVPLSGAKPRVLLIGDSFTEGLGLPFDSTFAGVLARRFASAGVEVLNAAAVSYSPAIYWKKVEYWLERGLRIDVVVVFIDISDIEDEAIRYRVDSAGHVVDAPEPHPGIIARWAHNSILLRSASKLLRLIHPHAPYGGCLAADLNDLDCRAGWTNSDVVMKRYGRVGLETAAAHMTRLAALLRAKRIPLTVVVYPWPQQLQWNDRSSRQVTHWKSWSVREGAGFTSLFDAFFAQVDAQGLDAAIARNFIPGDVHWSAAGHQLVAETFAGKLSPPAR